MAVTYKDVFSEYEIKETAIKFDGGEQFEKLGCVGSIDESMETVTVTKKCEGTIVKSVTRGTGNGELTLSLHMRYDLYVKAFGMEDAELKEGVVAYGRNSRHKEFTFVAKVKDEDGNEKLVAYPKCIMASAPKCSIENGAEEVSEIEVEISIFPDEHENGKYEAVVSALGSNAELANTWMTAFTSEIVRK